MNIQEVMKKIRSNDNFEIKPPCGLPILKSGHVLPDDLKEFYQICGGIDCYIEDGGFPMQILAPNKFELANKLLLGEEYVDDISSSWYVIVDAEDGNYISIDCNANRIGKCYESFEYSHAIRGNCPVIALSFTELLDSIVNYKGDYFFWKDNLDFTSYGDAYDKE